MHVVGRWGVVRKIALLVALVWSAGLPIAGSTLPMYTVEIGSSSGTISRNTDTLVDVNGSEVLIVLLVPLLVSVVVAAAADAEIPWGDRAIAWTMTAALAGLTARALLLIGIFLLPVPAALAVACAAEPAHPVGALPH